MQIYQSQVSRITDLTHDVREVHLRLLEPDSIAFKAGQSISVDVWHPKFNQHVQRQYSIASPSIQTHSITLLFNRVPQGLGSGYLFGLQVGDQVKFQGPDGSFFLDEPLGRDLVFVATGTGIAPFRSMLYTFLEKPKAGSLTVFWGLRSQRDLYYQSELEGLEQRHPHFRFIISLSKPENGWRGSIGRVTKLVENQILSVSNMTFFLCGNRGMIADTTEIIRAKGLCPIRTEQFYDDSNIENED